jgi:hypothetical protein
MMLTPSPVVTVLAFKLLVPSKAGLGSQSPSCRRTVFKRQIPKSIDANQVSL